MSHFVNLENVFLELSLLLLQVQELYFLANELLHLGVVSMSLLEELKDLVDVEACLDSV